MAYTPIYCGEYNMWQDRSNGLTGITREHANANPTTCHYDGRRRGYPLSLAYEADPINFENTPFKDIMWSKTIGEVHIYAYMITRCRRSEFQWYNNQWLRAYCDVGLDSTLENNPKQHYSMNLGQNAIVNFYSRGIAGYTISIDDYSGGKILSDNIDNAHVLNPNTSSPYEFSQFILNKDDVNTGWTKNWNGHGYHISNINQLYSKALNNMMNWLVSNPNQEGINNNNTISFIGAIVSSVAASFYFQENRYLTNMTKVYTNSTWSIKKTWYIKVIFNGPNGSYDSNKDSYKTRNVVNYVTMIQNILNYNST